MAKIKQKIRQKVSQALDVLIPANQWEAYVDSLDRDGAFTRKNMLSLAMISCQQIEKLEELVEDLYFQLDMMQGKQYPQVPPTPPVAEEPFKIRTVAGIMKDLDAAQTPNTKSFYVSESDWNILSNHIDPVLAHSNPEYGYGKELNEKTDRIEVCMYYHEKPVFKNIK